MRPFPMQSRCTRAFDPIALHQTRKRDRLNNKRGI